MYIPLDQGGPVIHPGTEFPFRRFLRLARLRWRYSNPPPHGSWPSVYSLGTDRTENTAPRSCYIVVCVSLPLSSNGRCLQSHCPASAVYGCSFRGRCLASLNTASACVSLRVHLHPHVQRFRLHVPQVDAR
jgi:hypothetical protein